MSLENLLVHESGALIIDMGMCLRVPHEQPESTYDNNTLVSDTYLRRSFDNMNIDALDAIAAIVATDTESNRESPEVEPISDFPIPNNIGNASTTRAGRINGTGIPSRSVQHRKRYFIRPQGTCGKWIYMSPEIYKNTSPFDGYAVDLWAAGVILFLMLTGFPPWDRACETDERFRYMSAGYLVQMLSEWEIGISADAMDLLQRMLFLDPKDRLSLEQVRAHPWMVNGPVRLPTTITATSSLMADGGGL
jgi:serine/threonine protein kinase